MAMYSSKAADRIGPQLLGKTCVVEALTARVRICGSGNSKTNPMNEDSAKTAAPHQGERLLRNVEVQRAVARGIKDRESRTDTTPKKRSASWPG